MSERFVNVDRDTPMLLPVDLRDWVPGDDMSENERRSAWQLIPGMGGSFRRNPHEALSLRKYLDRSNGEPANYIFCGDLNTMGLDYPYTTHDIHSEDEIRELCRRASHYTKDMRVLSKNQPHTWLPNPGSRFKPLDLDHVVAASHLTFTDFQGAQVDVRGWTQSDDPHDWAARYSDHALLYFEVGA